MEKSAKLLRQFPIRAADVAKVITATKAHGSNGVWVSTANDLPGIPWAQSQTFKLKQVRMLTCNLPQSNSFKNMVK